jgi:hypothetical protein
MKQTAVEWLYHKIVIQNSDCLKWRQYLEEAKEMEKQQIIKAVYDSMGTNFDPNMGRAEQYYNETFNSSNNK